MKDLEFIRKHVKEWPEGAETVRLDDDGEICFKGEVTSDIDFYPDDYHVGLFVPGYGKTRVGTNYNNEQWESASPKLDLTKLDTPFGELDRATQLALCEHVLDGGDVEVYVKGNVSEGWELGRKRLPKLLFMSGVKYRAKPKQPTRIEVLEGELKEIEAELKALKDGE